jgi:hypothetical protein
MYFIHLDIMLSFCCFQAQVQSSPAWNRAEKLAAMGVRKAKAGYKLVANILNRGCFKRRTSGRKPTIRQVAVSLSAIFRKTQLDTGNRQTYDMAFMLGRMKLQHKNKIACVNTPTTIKDVLKLLLTENVISDGIPKVGAESTNRKQQGEIIGTSIMYDSVCLNDSDYSNIQFDGSKKDGTSYLSLGASTWVVDKTDPNKGQPANIQLAMIRMAADVPIDTTPASAIMHTKYISETNKIYALPLHKIAFVTVDSCATNVGSKGGVVIELRKLAVIEAEAEINDVNKEYTGPFYENTCLHTLPCTAHILHNALGTGIIGAWGKDPVMKRQGNNSPAMFFLETLSNKVRGSGKKFLEGVNKVHIPTCPGSTQTRWNTYSQVATWLVKHHVHVMAKVTAMPSPLNDTWLWLIKRLSDAEMMLKVTIISEVGHLFSTWAFNWLEKNCSFLAHKIHWFLQQANIFCCRMHIETEICFPATFKLCGMYADQNKFSNCSSSHAKSYILEFAKHFSDYFHRKTDFWFLPPFSFALAATN